MPANCPTIGVTTQQNSGFVVGLIDRGGSPGTVADNMGNTYVQIGTAQVKRLSCQSGLFEIHVDTESASTGREKR